MWDRKPSRLISVASRKFENPKVVSTDLKEAEFENSHSNNLLIESKNQWPSSNYKKKLLIDDRVLPPQLYANSKISLCAFPRHGFRNGILNIEWFSEKKYYVGLSAFSRNWSVYISEKDHSMPFSGKPKMFFSYKLGKQKLEKDKPQMKVLPNSSDSFYVIFNGHVQVFQANFKEQRITKKHKIKLFCFESGRRKNVKLYSRKISISDDGHYCAVSLREQGAVILKIEKYQFTPVFQLRNTTMNWFNQQICGDWRNFPLVRPKGWDGKTFLSENWFDQTRWVGGIFIYRGQLDEICFFDPVKQLRYFYPLNGDTITKIQPFYTYSMSTYPFVCGILKKNKKQSAFDQVEDRALIPVESTFTLALLTNTTLPSDLIQLVISYVAWISLTPSPQLQFPAILSEKYRIALTDLYSENERLIENSVRADGLNLKGFEPAAQVRAKLVIDFIKTLLEKISSNLKTTFSEHDFQTCWNNLLQQEVFQTIRKELKTLPLFDVETSASPTYRRI